MRSLFDDRRKESTSFVVVVQERGESAMVAANMTVLFSPLGCSLQI
jgi:hypothetical protein